MDGVAPLTEFCASVRICPMPFERSSLSRAAAAGLSVLSSAPFDRIWLHSGAMHRAATALASHAPVDLVHVDTVGLMPCARHFPGATIVLNHHNVESALTRRRAAREPSRWRALLLERDAAKEERVEREEGGSAGVNLVCSDIEGARLRALEPGSRVAVVANGVDTRYFTPAPCPGPEGGLVFVGTLGWHANRDAARFLATEILPALGPSARSRPVTVIGRDPQRQDWGAAAERIVAPGMVADIRPLLRQACIYVCPIREGGGTRLKVLVALAMGKPLVATALAVEGLRLEAGRHYLAAESASEFADQIRRLEGDGELRARLASAGRRLVEEEYDWRVIGEQLAAAYSQATGREVSR